MKNSEICTSRQFIKRSTSNWPADQFDAENQGGFEKWERAENISLKLDKSEIRPAFLPYKKMADQPSLSVS